jgi:hypothetical protein
MALGRPKKIESSEKLWEYFLSYKQEVKDNPIIGVEQKRGNSILPKDISNIEESVLNKMLNPVVELPIQRPLTMEGFENWLSDNDIIEDLGDYLKNKDERYTDFTSICSRIRRTIKQDQIEGGMAGIYNASITQRLNGLVDKKETEIKGSLNIPNLPDIGNRK